TLRIEILYEARRMVNPLWRGRSRPPRRHSCRRSLVGNVSGDTTNWWGRRFACPRTADREAERGERCSAADRAGESPAPHLLIQPPVHLGIAQHRLHVVARLGERDALDELRRLAERRPGPPFAGAIRSG